MPDPSLGIQLDGKALPGDVMARLTQVEVRESDADPTIATLRFSLAQGPDGRFFVLDDTLFGPATPVDVDIAAPGGLSTRLLSGFVTHVRPHFEAIESNCYLEILVMDVGALLDVEERVASYPDSSDSEAAEEIFKRYKIENEVKASAARHAADRQLLVQRGTDLDFLAGLARRNGYAFFFEYDPDKKKVIALFHPPDLEGTAQADLTILQGDDNLEWVDFQWSAAAPVRVVGHAIDPFAKQILTSTSEGVNAEGGERGLADDVEAGLKKRGVEFAQHLLRDPLPLEAAISAEGDAATDRAKDLVEARGQVDPTLYRGLLRARRPVLLKGVGDRLSGRYYVRGVRTEVVEGRVTQTFVAHRNALGRTGRERFGQQAEEVPPQ